MNEVTYMKCAFNMTETIIYRLKPNIYILNFSKKPMVLEKIQIRSFDSKVFWRNSKYNCFTLIYK